MRLCRSPPGTRQVAVSASTSSATVAVGAVSSRAIASALCMCASNTARPSADSPVDPPRCGPGVAAHRARRAGPPATSRQYGNHVASYRLHDQSLPGTQPRVKRISPVPAGRLPSAGLRLRSAPIPAATRPTKKSPGSYSITYHPGRAI
jgi:hypothetical protein